jgi:predicted small integral membrane protein
MEFTVEFYRNRKLTAKNAENTKSFNQQSCSLFVVWKKGYYERYQIIERPGPADRV